MQKDGEPSVEEILRSIKQVISRDDDQQAPGMTGSSVPDFGAQGFGRRTSFSTQPPAAANSAADDTKGDDVYDLGALPTGEEAPEPEAPIDLPAAFADADMTPEPESDDIDPEPDIATPPVYAAFEPEIAETAEPANEAPEQEPEPDEPEPEARAEAPTGGLIAGTAAASVRDQLARLDALAASAPPSAAPANPLEDMVREMLRPMLKDWLDANLESVIERMVEREIARITGRR